LPESKNRSYLHGAAILTIAVLVVKVIGAIYKIPLLNMLGNEGSGYFTAAYAIYALFLTVSTSGLPVALSKMISTANALDRPNQVKRIFSVGRAAFFFLGLVSGLVMFLFAGELAGSEGAVHSVRVLAPAVLFACLISAYRGYAQGHSDMVPTSVSQTIEALGKLVFGLSLAWWFLRSGKGVPMATGASMAGVTIGAFLALVFLAAYKRLRGRPARRTSAHQDVPEARGRILKRLIQIGVPIALSASFLSIIGLIDTRMILARLQGALGMSESAANSLLGIYGKVQTLHNVPPYVITPLTISFIPSITALISKKADASAAAVMESGLKMTNLIAMPCAAGLSAVAALIVEVVYRGSGAEAPGMLMIMGIASFFVCTMLMTNAILQAYGFERFTVYTVVIGGIIKVVLNWFLLGTPSVGIYGAAVSSVVCYLVISILNLTLIMRKVPHRPRLVRAYGKPLAAAAVMGVAAWACGSLFQTLFTGVFTSGIGPLSAGYVVSILSLGCAVLVAAVVYIVLIVALGALTYEDMKMLPKGEKLAKLLRIRP